MSRAIAERAHMTSAATDIRAFRSEDEMFHGFREVLGDLGLSDATIAVAWCLHDAFLRPVFHGVGLEHEEAPIPGGHAVIHGEENAASR